VGEVMTFRIDSVHWRCQDAPKPVVGCSVQWRSGAAAAYTIIPMGMLRSLLREGSLKYRSLKEVVMGRIGWFDSESNELKFSEYLEKMESWQKALADGVVQPDEVRGQAEKVSEMLRALEPKLSDELHEELTQILYEWAVLQAMDRLVELTEAEREV